MQDESKSSCDAFSFCRNQPPCLQQVLKECNYRYAVMDNVTKPQGQVELLLNKIRKMKESNGNLPYQCPKYAEIRQQMDEEISQRMLSVEADEVKNKKYVWMLKSSILHAKETALKEKQELVEKEKRHQEQTAVAQQQQSSLVQNMMADLQRQAQQEEERRREIIALQNAQAVRLTLMESERQQRLAEQEQRLVQIREQNNALAQEICQQKDSEVARLKAQFEQEQAELRAKLNRLRNN